MEKPNGEEFNSETDDILFAELYKLENELLVAKYDNILIYTDGSCKPNPGMGGWAAIILFKVCLNITNVYKKKNGKILEKVVLKGYSVDITTNNVMELTGPLEALLFTEQYSLPIHIVSDSRYFVDGVTKWIDGWKKKNWKTSSGNVANLELWKQIDRILSLKSNISVSWVKAHHKDPFNNEADTIANHQAEIAKVVSQTKQNETLPPSPMPQHGKMPKPPKTSLKCPNL